MFPLLLVSLSRGFGGSGSGKLLNNRSFEAVGRLWHLSPITVEPPFPCHRPDQPVSHIYDPLSVVTSVKHVPCCLTLTQILRIPHLSQTSGQPLQDSAGFLPFIVPKCVSFGACLVWVFFFGFYCSSRICKLSTKNIMLYWPLLLEESYTT